MDILINGSVRPITGLPTVELHPDNLSNWSVLPSVDNWSNCSVTADGEKYELAFQIVHGVIIPIIATVGLVLNMLNLIVLNHSKLVESSYTYLSGLAFADFCTLLVYCINGIGRGYYPNEGSWRVFEAFVYFPCGFVTSTAGALLTVTVSTERFVFIYKPMKAKIWCTRRVARIVMAVLWIICVALHIPRFFVFTIDHNKGKLDYTDFGKSNPYKYLSWFQFLFVSCSCGVVLIILNIFLILGVHKTNVKRQALMSSSKNQKLDELRLTRTLISLVFIYLVGEIPSAMTSRSLIIGLSGDPCVVENKAFKILSLVTSVLAVLQLSLNFVVYCVFNPRFWATFKQQMCTSRCCVRTRKVKKDNNNAMMLSLPPLGHCNGDSNIHHNVSEAHLLPGD